MDSDTKLTQTMKYQLSRNVFHLKGDFPPTKKNDWAPKSKHSSGTSTQFPLIVVSQLFTYAFTTNT